HSDSDTAGLPPLVARGVLAVGRTTNLVLTVLPDQIELHVDGELIDVRHTDNTTETWSEDTVLTVGDSPVGERAWLGWLESGRLELDGVEILNIVESANDMRPERIHHIPGRIRNVLEHGGLPPTGLIDMLVNLLGFVPLGFLGARAWRIRPLHAVLLLVVCTSMTMELGQIAFADRTPSVLDLTLNLIGGMLGALLFSRIQPSDRV
ncbi:MAG: VanZ family protein, partial [Gammaproteobacteria bacterium]|nr:VanZ family protein [Gammaproteobacteria bacterium]